jgi:hypothetical protein
MTWIPLVERMVVVMLFGSLELALEPTLTGREVGCGLWVEVGAALCRVGLGGLVERGIAAGDGVGDGEYIDVDKWVVVELTSRTGGVISTLLGVTGSEGLEGKLRSSEIRYVFYSHGRQTYQLDTAHKIGAMASSAKQLKNRPRVHPG